MSHVFHPSVLREYDIRGIIGETLGVEDARAIGRGFATLAARGRRMKVAVGYDGRTSSPMLEHALVEGLTASGCDVVRIGMGATPMLYYAEASAEDVDGGIQITGSHNPANYNGFKMVFQGRPFFGADIVTLGRIAGQGGWATRPGTVEDRQVLDAYVSRILAGLDGIDHAQLGKLRVRLGCRERRRRPRAREARRAPARRASSAVYRSRRKFSQSSPGSTVEANLADLKALVAEKQLDFGIAFDGDGDRIGAIDGEGRVIWGDQLLMIYAEDLLRLEPGATIIADVKAQPRAVPARRRAWRQAGDVEDRAQPDQIQNEAAWLAARRRNERSRFLRP